jgi:hypothetical protein
MNNRIAGAILVALCLCDGACRRAAAGPEQPEVYVASPVQRDISIYSDWIGTTVGFVDAEIHSEVTGYLLSQDCFRLTRNPSRLSSIKPKPVLTRPKPS